jgi:hypothetical protein
MKPIRRLIARLRRGSEALDDPLEKEQAERMRDEITNIRLSTRSGSAAENYQTGRGSRHSR